MTNKKEYVSPEVNVILVEKDVITLSGLDPVEPGEGIETPEIPTV